MCISIVPIFNHLNPDEMNEIVKTTNSVTHPRGDTIYHAGEKSDGLYIVHKGRVKIYRLSETGKEQLVRILDPGDFTGELSLFNESVHDAYAEAMEVVELCVMSRADFQAYLLKYPAIALKVLTEFATRLGKTEKQSANIAMESAETRVAMYLADQVEEHKNKHITLPMSSERPCFSSRDNTRNRKPETFRIRRTPVGLNKVISATLRFWIWMRCCWRDT